MARTYPGGTGTDGIQITEYAAMSSLTTFTMCAIAKRTGAGGGGFGRLLETDENGMLEDNGSNFMRFSAYRWTTNGEWSYPMPADNATHTHIVSYDYSSVNIVPLVWVDGVAQSVTTQVVPVAPATVPLTENKIGVGTDIFTPSSRAWKGDLEHVAIWAHRKLTATGAGSEISAVVNCGPNVIPADRVLYLPIAGDTSPEPNIDSPANTGTVTGTLTQVAGTTFSNCTPPEGGFFSYRRRVMMSGGR